MYPPITAVMVTIGRRELISESYRCFLNQTYPNKKLLIVPDPAGYEMVARLPETDPWVSVLKIDSKLTVGACRNLGLQHSTTDLTIQWDDDDWYAPERMMTQWRALRQSKAVMLIEQLHYFRDTAQVAWTVDPTGIEGTVLLDRRCGVQYPDQQKGEDTVLKHELIRRGLLTLIPGGTLYCRTYHGSNSWERSHHIRRVQFLGKSGLKKFQEGYKMYPWRDDWTPLQVVPLKVL
jgi:glycosyltransferase involved in cell wall biosynthesis